MNDNISYVIDEAADENPLWEVPQLARAELAAMQERIAKLESALAPFVQHHSAITQDEMDAARALLAEKE